MHTVYVGNPQAFKTFMTSALASASKAPKGRRHNDFMKDLTAYAHIKSPALTRALRDFLPLPSERTTSRHVASHRAPIVIGPDDGLMKHVIENVSKLMADKGVAAGQCPWVLATDETAVTAAFSYYKAEHKGIGFCGVAGDGHRCTVDVIDLPYDLDDESKYPDGAEYFKDLLRKHKLASCE
jgi:hypothetical protein